MVCLMKLAYQKFDSVKKSLYLCNGKVFCQYNNLVIIHPYSFNLNENVRTFMRKVFEDILYHVLHIHKHLLELPWLLYCTLRFYSFFCFMCMVIFITKLFLTVVQCSIAQKNNPSSSFFTF